MISDDRLKRITRTMTPYLPFLLIGGALTLGAAVNYLRQLYEPETDQASAPPPPDSALSYVPPDQARSTGAFPPSSAGGFGSSSFAIPSQGKPDPHLLENPIKLTIAPSGDVYFIDGRKIRKIDKKGNLSTIAGARGAVGPKTANDGIFKNPVDLASDSKGDLFVADMEDHRVRRIDPNGIITIVAGVGPCGIDRYGRIVGGSAGAGGPATEAQLNFPRAVACDAHDNLYIGDKGRLCIVGHDGILRQIAGTGEERFRGFPLANRTSALRTPIHVTDIATDREGSIYFSDDIHHLVRKLTPKGEIAVVAGNPRMNARGARMAGFSGDGGPATKAELSAPNGLAFDSEGNLFIADKGNGRIREVDKRGIVRTIAGDGVSAADRTKDIMGAETLYKPTSLAFNQKGDLYFIDSPAHRIYKKSANGPLAILAENRDPFDRSIVSGRLPGDLRRR